MTGVAPTLTGQDINLAARATRKALEVLLAEQGASFPPLAAMNAIAARGAVSSRDALVRMLTNAMDVDSQTIHTVLHGLATRGLIGETVDGHLELTALGTAEHQRLNALIGQLTSVLYADFDPGDLATARRVLATLTERAEARVNASLSRNLYAVGAE